MRPEKLDKDRMMVIKTFRVTEDHLKLLKQLQFGYEGNTEFGAPAVDPKRPYGNSDVYRDIAEILEIEPQNEDSGGEMSFSDIQIEKFNKLHQSMATVLQILVVNGSVDVGEYSSSMYGIDWKPSST